MRRFVTHRSIIAVAAALCATGAAHAEVRIWNASPQVLADQSSDGGQVLSVTSTFDTSTNVFTWSATFGAVPGHPELTTDGFTLAVSPGPNPKNHPGELALVYFDATGATPEMTIYGYNALNNFSSYYDGSNQNNTQPPDRILSSLAATATAFLNISAVNNGDGTRTLGFTLDASDVNNHTPLYPDQQDPWTGMAFGEHIGAWFHPMAGVSASYQNDYLSSWSFRRQGWIDCSNQTTVPEPAAFILLALGGLFSRRRFGM